MRISFVALVSVFFLFIGCNEDDDNPTGSTSPLIGNWILAKEMEVITVNNVIVEKDSMVYPTPAESYLLFAFSKSLFYMYEKDDIDSVTYLDSITYTASGGKLTVMGETVDYTISGSTLFISQKEIDVDTTYQYDMYLSRYSGNIPPDGWPPISFEPKQAKLFLARNHKSLK